VWLASDASGPSVETLPRTSWPGEEIKVPGEEVHSAGVLDGLINLNWQEVATLFGGQETMSKGLKRRNQSGTSFEINDSITNAEESSGYVPNSKTFKASSGNSLEEDFMNEILSQVQATDASQNLARSTLNPALQDGPALSTNSNDPAPQGALSFEQVRDILLDAERGNFDSAIKKRFGVSPINPNGPKQFYVIDRMCEDVSNIYAEKNLAKTKAVRSRSTKRMHWFLPDNSLGLRYRELAKKERKTGDVLKFGGCTYELVRNIDGVICSASVPHFLQIWPLSRNLPFASLLGKSDEKETVLQVKSESEDVKVAHFVYDVFNRMCDALEPSQFKEWSGRYSKLLFSSGFGSALKSYIKRDDPRLKESFLFPTSMVPNREFGIFRGQMSEEVHTEGALCIFADDKFKQLVGMDPVGMKGFFNSVLSPLQRFCISRVFWGKLASARQGVLTYFKTWQICQTALTLHDRTQRIFRIAIRIVEDDNGGHYFETKAQDVTEMYPEITRLQPFLA